MSQNSDTPQGDLWLTDGRSAPTIDHRNVLVRGKYWLDMLQDHEDITHAWIGLVNDDHSVRWVAELIPASMPTHFFEGRCMDVIQQRHEFVFVDHQKLISGGLFPLIRGGKVFGILALVSGNTDYFKSGTRKWLHTLTRLMSDGLVGTEDAEYSVLQSLLASLDVLDGLPAVLNIIARSLGADAITVLRYIPLPNRYELLGTYGLAKEEMAKIKFYFDAGLAGRILGDQPVWIKDLREDLSGPRPIYRLDEEGFRGYLAVPLIAHQHLVGALEAAWRSPRHTKTWSDVFLERVGGQIALAMEHSQILDGIRRDNVELTARYNAMIEGLSRSLELRDLETEGHTRRVSELTLRLVQHMKIPADQWDAIRQGALLHDIGKLGIPDAILLKPGSLTPREEKVMQQHVIYGHNILAPVTDERDILEITLYHHEHWDGTGYPYGLKGEQIPRMARVFTVVDVFDALTSDRPYRTAWPRSKVIEYLQKQAGRYFDPQVVKLFLEIITE